MRRLPPGDWGFRWLTAGDTWGLLPEDWSVGGAAAAAVLAGPTPPPRSLSIACCMFGPERGNGAPSASGEAMPDGLCQPLRLCNGRARGVGMIFNATSSAAPLPQATFNQAVRRWGTWVPIAVQPHNTRPSVMAAAQEVA